MDATQDARSKLHTFPRHRWKRSGDERGQSNSGGHHHPPIESINQPNPAIETKCCQYEKRRFVSLKSQSDVSPSNSLCCRTNRFVHSHRPKCFAVSRVAHETATTQAIQSQVCQRDDSWATWLPFVLASYCSCAVLGRFASKQRHGCWKWSFHNMATAVSAIWAQFLTMLVAICSALCSLHSQLVSRSSNINEVQRIVRTMLPMMLLFNMLPLLHAGE